MRQFSYGKPFLDIEADDVAPGEQGLAPVFSEANLYPRMGKGDARFILSIADEYELLRNFLGQETTERLLRAARRFAEGSR